MEDLENEFWVDIEGYEGYYQASNMGRIKSFGRTVIFGDRTRHTKDRILKPSKRLDGYMVINLLLDGKREVFNVHRLIASIFIPNPENKCDVDHKDGDKSNNKVENLRWTTRKENLDNRKHKRKGGIRKIKCITTDEIFNTLEEASKKYGIKPATIASCCKGHSRTTGSNIDTETRLMWKYIEQ